MNKRICQSLTILLLVLLVFSRPLVTNAEGEKTPAPESVVLAHDSITWEPAEYKSNLKFRIYFKDKWSGESYKLIATCKGYDPEHGSAGKAIFKIRDASDEKDPQITKEKKDGYTYYSIPVISGHKYKAAVKVYDEEYGLWSDITTSERYFLSIPDASIEQTEKGLSISWNPVPGATKYRVIRYYLSSKTSDDEEKVIIIPGNDQTRFDDEDVIDKDVYMYEVQAGRGNWFSAFRYSMVRVAFPE
ncbi:MAG: hypothetical protein II627_04995 [Lachnospiraceae bacterium]|nr:hypothetical protein [Lachnospiraceae bacterium]